VTAFLKATDPFMESTHYRTGEKALLSYNVSKGPELSDPDPNSAPTGNTCFILSEIYERDRSNGSGSSSRDVSVEVVDADQSSEPTDSEKARARLDQYLRDRRS
jgi:hypothetical protein